MGINDLNEFANSLNPSASVGFVMSADDRNPDDVAESLRIGAELGVPANIVGAEPKPFKRQAEQKRNSTILSNAPKTAAWLADLTNSGLAKDDVDNLSWLEGFWKRQGEAWLELGDAGKATVPGRAVQRGLKRIEAAPPGMRATATGRKAVDIGRSLDDLIAEEMDRIGGESAPASMRVVAMQVAQQRFDNAKGQTESDRVDLLRRGGEDLAKARGILDEMANLPMSDTATKFRDETLANAGPGFMDTLGAFASDPAGGAAFVAETAAEVLPVLLASTATTAVTRSPAAGVGVMAGGSFLMENTSSALEFLQEKGVDISTPEAAAEVLANEAIMQEARQRGVTRGLVIAMFDAVSGGVAGKTLMRSPMGDTIAQGFAQMFFGGAGEGAAQLASGQEINWQEIVIEGLAELATAPIEVGGVAGRAFLTRMSKKSKSGTTAGRLDEVDAKVAESKLKARSPEKFAEFINQTGASDEFLYVPADDLTTYFQAKDVPLEDGLSSFGIDPVEFEEMRAAGSDVAVPMATYASQISGTEDAAWFRENATLDASEMSLTQAQRFNEEVRDVMQDAIEQADRQRQDDLNVRASDIQVYDNIFSQLRSAGRTRDVADHEARVWSAFFRTMGERYGEDALDMARSMGVQIQGPESQQFRVRSDLDISLNTLRAGKGLKPRGESLSEFVREKGGVRDEGGDVDAMDPPKGLIAETRSEVQERRSQPTLGGMPAQGRGMGLDEMARAAIEAGYPLNMLEGADEANALLDALRDDLGGNPIYLPGEGVDPELQRLSDELSARGIDPAAMSNDEIAAALEQPADGVEYDQSGTFDPDDPRILFQGDRNTKRGSITLPSGGLEQGQTVINLFDGADLSSILHESGHFFLEAFQTLAAKDDAPQGMKDDLAAIYKFLEVEDASQIGTPQHEKWARGFEAYLMEGKAPSLELADAFGRFKAWLTRIYQTVRGLNVKLTPDVREVMDRMLATDAEIAAAREVQEMQPLFTSQSAAGMSDAAWATYQRMARRSAEQANQALLEKTMDAVRRKTQKWWKAERKEVRAEVEKTVSSQREHRLVEMLANKKWIGSDRDVPDMQIDRKALVEMFPEGVLVELSVTRLGGDRAIYGTGENAMHPEEVADFFGFANASEMVQILQNTGKRREAIESETDRIMLDRYGDPLNDGSIEEEALAAIHSKQQANTVASEVRHLSERAGRPSRNLTAKVFRQRAQAMIGRMSVREATRPDAFLAAERKAAKRSEDAFARVARGDADALGIAAQHKEQQLLNHYLYMESRDLRDMVKSKREKMRKYSKKSVREKLDGGYIEQIDAILDGYDFRVRSAGQVEGMEKLRDFVVRMEAEGRAGELAIDERLMDEANRKHYTRLAVDELRGLFDTIANIDHLGRLKKTVQDAQEARNLDEIVSGVQGQFDANVSGEPPSRTPDAGESRRKTGRDYLNTVLNADTLLREIDGFKDLGPMWSALKQKIDEGMARLAERRLQMAKDFDAIYDRYTGKEKRAMAVKVHNDALGVPMSKWDLISLALNTGNENNFERLTNPKVKGHFSQASIEAALADLSTKDWETVQAIWDYIDSFWPEISAKEKRQTGVVPEKVTPKMMLNAAPGFVRGGYYPIKYDPRLSGLTDSFQQKELADSLIGGMFGKAQTRNGHTKERGTTSRQPVMLDLSVAHTHVEQVLYDLEIGEAVAGSWRILQDGRIKAAFIEKGKKSDFDALEIWLQDVASGERVAAGGLQSIMRHIRSGFTISRLAINISTALIQPTGLVQSAVQIGKADVARGTIDYMSNIPRWVSEVTEVSALMRERKKTFERDIFNVVGDLEGGPTSGYSRFHKNVIIPASFWLMQQTQFYGVDMPTWVSAYQKEVKASGDEAKARLYADTMVKRAQGSGLMSDRGMLERGTLNRDSRQQEFPRMLTALGSYMFAKGNVAYESAMKTDFKNPVEVMNLAADIALLFTLEAILYSAIKGYLPDEDEDKTTWLVKETAFSAMSSLPLLREFSGALQGFSGGGIFGSSIEVLARPMVQAGQGEFDRALVTSVTDAAGVALHLPSSQVKAAINNLFEADMSLNPDASLIGALGLGQGKGRSIADIMFAD